MYTRRPDSSTRNDEVIAIAHSPNSLDDVALVVGNHLDALKLDAEREAVFREERRIGVDCLDVIVKRIHSLETERKAYLSA